jgi:hypothetical protein
MIDPTVLNSRGVFLHKPMPDFVLAPRTAGETALTGNLSRKVQVLITCPNAMSIWKNEDCQSTARIIIAYMLVFGSDHAFGGQ